MQGDQHPAAVGCDAATGRARGSPPPRSHQLARRGRAEGDQRRRIDQLDLALEPVQAGRGLLLRRRLVDPALAAQLELEVLDGVGDVDRRALDRRAPRGRASNSWPAGPTKGRPCRSSWSPGCSPTNISFAPAAAPRPGPPGSRARRSGIRDSAPAPRAAPAGARGDAAGRLAGTLGDHGRAPFAARRGPRIGPLRLRQGVRVAPGQLRLHRL